MTLEVVDGAVSRADTAAFYFDLSSPSCYLTAERILSTMPVPCEWRPVVAAQLPNAAGDGIGTISREMVELVAIERALQPLRWPEPTPFDSDLAMRAAAFAMGAGKTVAFSLAAFRQAFAGGRVLDEDTILLAGAACEIHPRALLQGVGLRTTQTALDRCMAQAAEHGVTSVPAIWTGDALCAGDGALEAAVERLTTR